MKMWSVVGIRKDVGEGVHDIPGTVNQERFLADGL